MERGGEMLDKFSYLDQEDRVSAIISEIEEHYAHNLRLHEIYQFLRYSNDMTTISAIINYAIDQIYDNPDYPSYYLSLIHKASFNKATQDSYFTLLKDRDKIKELLNYLCEKDEYCAYLIQIIDSFRRFIHLREYPSVIQFLKKQVNSGKTALHRMMAKALVFRIEHPNVVQKIFSWTPPGCPRCRNPNVQHPFYEQWIEHWSKYPELGFEARYMNLPMTESLPFCATPNLRIPSAGMWIDVPKKEAF